MDTGADSAVPNGAADRADRDARAAGDPPLPCRTVAVVTAGVRRPSSTAELARRLADATSTHLAAEGYRAEMRWLELRPYAVDLAEATVGGMPSSALRAAIDDVTGADGVIAVTPTFAASYAGQFKSFFDVLAPDALTGMPTLLGATGGSARHSLVIEYALRPLLNYFRAVIVPTGVFAAADEAGGAADGAGGSGSVGGGAGDRLARRIDRAGVELASVVARAPGVKPLQQRIDSR